jgi:hypothetical protein
MYEIKDEYKEYRWMGTLGGKFVVKELGKLTQDELAEMYKYPVQHKYYKPRGERADKKAEAKEAPKSDS